MRFIKASFVIVAFLASPLLGAAGFENLYGPDVNITRRGVGASGYDVVAYQTEGKAKKGLKSIFLDHEGVRYYFRRDENRALFVSDPKKYLPAYGGWCAFGMGMAFGQFEGWNPGKYKVDPENFKIVEGKLMLFYKTADIDGLEEWNKDEDALLESADDHWKAMTKKTER